MCVCGGVYYKNSFHLTIQWLPLSQPDNESVVEEAERQVSSNQNTLPGTQYEASVDRGGDLLSK